MSLGAECTYFQDDSLGARKGISSSSYMNDGQAFDKNISSPLVHESQLLVETKWLPSPRLSWYMIIDMIFSDDDAGGDSDDGGHYYDDSSDWLNVDDDSDHYYWLFDDDSDDDSSDDSDAEDEYVDIDEVVDENGEPARSNLREAGHQAGDD